MIEALAKDMTAVLMREGQLVLPGIGLFSLQVQTATISMIEGRAKPAGKKAVFNPNLLLDDGRLLRYWMQHKGWSSDKAQTSLENSCQAILDQLGQGESVSLSGIGRLFRDYNGDIKFTPSEQNLDTATFGLPAVPIAAVVRTERAVAPTSSAAMHPSTVTTTLRMPSTSSAAGSSAAAASPAAFLQQAYAFLQSYVWHIAAATLLLFVLTTWYLGRKDRPTTAAASEIAGNRSTTTEDTAMEESNTTVEASTIEPIVPPAIEDERGEAYAFGEEGTATDKNTTTNNPPATPPQNEQPATTAPSSAANFAVIAVGRYGKKENVEKMISRIEAAGYVAYSRQGNGLTRVGVQYAYKSEGELDEALTDVRRRFSQDAFILSRSKSN